MSNDETDDGPLEIAIMGDLSDADTEVADSLLSVPQGGECTLYFDCPGGSAYRAIALLSLIQLRELKATGVVLGECSSAALWPFAACQKRIVTPYSVLLFHPIRWQSEEDVLLPEAAEWARHFAELETSMDKLLAEYFQLDEGRLNDWMRPGRYVSGAEFAEAGLAELREVRPT